MNNNSNGSLKNLYYDSHVWFLILEYSNHEDLAKWVQTCTSIQSLVRLHKSEFFMVDHSQTLESNLVSFVENNNWKMVKYLTQQKWMDFTNEKKHAKKRTLFLCTYVGVIIGCTFLLGYCGYLKK